jgi:hypothetical protein
MDQFNLATLKDASAACGLDQSLLLVVSLRLAAKASLASLPIKARKPAVAKRAAKKGSGKATKTIAKRRGRKAVAV